jgi:hypothetical protein
MNWSLIFLFVSSDDDLDFSVIGSFFKIKHNENSICKATENRFSKCQQQLLSSLQVAILAPPAKLARHLATS